MAPISVMYQNTNYRNTNSVSNQCFVGIEMSYPNYKGSFEDDSDGGSTISECTNPYLERLLQRYFPSDDEDNGCDADGEYDTTRELYQIDEFMPARARRSPTHSKISPWRRRQMRSRRFSNSEDNIYKVVLEDEEKEEVLMNTAQWLEEARRHYVVGEVKRQKEHHNDNGDFFPIGMQTLNTTSSENIYNSQGNSAWDSSPSTVASDNNAEILDIGPPRLVRDCHDEDDIRKSLFTQNSVNSMNSVNSITPDMMLLDQDMVSQQIENYDFFELDTDDDLELTYRARKIQHDLRLQEMEELAIEAERAAEEGKKKFVGSATKFGADFDELHSDRRNAINETNLLSQCRNSITTNTFQRYAENSMLSPRFNQRGMSFNMMPSTDIKRPKPLSASSRLSSAPSKLQNRNPPSAFTVPSTVSSILTATSFLSLTTQNPSEKKVPVLSLRHIEEVIPSFREMHPFIRSHMVRAGVKEQMLMSQDQILNSVQNDNDNDDNVKGKADEKESNTGSRASSNSIFPRIQSFQKLFTSLSGLSLDDKKKIQSTTLDSDIEYGSIHDADDCNSVDHCKNIDNCFDNSDEEHLTDCVSLVSCGDSSIDCALVQKNEEKISDEKLITDGSSSISQEMKLNDEDNGDDNLLNKSHSTDIYVCILASEIRSPNQRPRSPPTLPLFGLEDDNDLKVLLAAESSARNGSPPKSRWSSFWANISPRRSLNASSSPKISDPTPWMNVRDSHLTPRRSVTESFPPNLSDLTPRRSVTEYFPPNLSDLTPRRSLTASSPPKISDPTPWMNVREYQKTDFQSFAKPRVASVSTQQDTETEEFPSFLLSPNLENVPNETVHQSLNNINNFTENNSMPNTALIHPISRLGISQDAESATSPRPPLYPAGTRLANNLLHNAGIKLYAEEKKLLSNESEHTHVVNSVIQSEIRKNDTSDSECIVSSQSLPDVINPSNVDSKYDTYSYPKQIKPLRTISKIRIMSDADNCLKNDIDHTLKNDIGDAPDENDDDIIVPGGMSRQQSFSSVHSCCIGEESALCVNASVNTSIHGVKYDELVQNAQKVDEEMEESFTDDNQNKSMTSFIGLMENVKVPSVMEKLSPLLGRKETQKSAYHDDEAFIGNYFYVGVGLKSEESSRFLKGSYDGFQQNRRGFCERNQCSDAGCEGFGTSVIEQTFNLLSRKNRSWDKDSGPLLNEPRNYDDGQPWLKKALSQCSGRLPRYQRREEVVIGRKRFRAPNLQIQRGSFFTEDEEDECHQTFKVSHKSLASDVNEDHIQMFPGIDIGPIEEHEHELSQSFMHFDKSKLQGTKEYRKQMTRSSCQSLLTHSDDDNSEC